MKACILCPGPSLMCLVGTDPRSRYELIVGVNRAAEAFQCDYWVALDTCTFGMTQALGHPVLVTSAAHYRKMCLQWPGAADFESLDPKTLASHKLAPGWTTKGLLTAIVVAYAKGAGVIDCLGVDWEGTEDFDGKTFPGQVRTAKRWEKEARWFDILKTILGKQGVSVTRMTETRSVDSHSERGCR